MMGEPSALPRPAAPPVADVNLPARDGDDDMPRVEVTARRAVLVTLFVILSLAALYLLLPQLAGLEETWNRINEGKPGWIFAALVFQVLSLGGYIAMFQSTCVPPSGEPRQRIQWSESYQITMAGVAATRLFAAGGAGGVALTAWALRRAGMDRREVATRLFAFLVLLYGVYMAALLIAGIGLRVGLFPGRAPFAMTVVPAIFAGVVILLFLAMTLVPADFERRLGGWARGPRHPRMARWLTRAATVPATVSSGMRVALGELRSPSPGLLGAIAWWAFNVAVLWAAFHAFGDAPPLAVVVMGYFVGMLGNLLPLPGGIGGVDGGMIGAFIAFGVPGGLAIVAVLVYRGFSFWLPTIPGVVAYLQLRRTVHRWREEPAPAA